MLVEVHDGIELQRAYQLNPQIIGVNNRDLKSFNTDVKHTNQILNVRKRTIYIFLKVEFIHNKRLSK